MSKSCSLIFPHQLFKEGALLKLDAPIYLLEEHLFFSQYNFHKQKLALHRASMKFYEGYLKSLKLKVNYIEAINKQHDVRILCAQLAKDGVKTLNCYNPTDYMLQRRLQAACKKHAIELVFCESNLFINTKEDLAKYKAQSKRYFQTDFYTYQRKRLNVLIDKDGKPAGGKWTFDAENRERYPKGKVAPAIYKTEDKAFYKEAVQYVNKHFTNNFGALNNESLYAITHAEAQASLQHFFKHRFEEFGIYEDALVANENILHHSVLTPMLNVGLITAKEVLENTLQYYKQNVHLPLNSVEGFVRQVLGWREFMRYIYTYEGVPSRTKNYWGFTRKIPASFYDGTTGIVPIDNVIKKVLATGYCHHIERLMVLGNFMLLCEFDPNEVYRWFMELFIDSYDWVMVPNVYGMTQFADGGIFATKPYISGSNYLMKMSDYPKGDWQKTWDALFWHFMNKQRDFFLSNPRLGMLVRTYDKMDEAKRKAHLDEATKWFKILDGG
jgi:deoxyribodipyrimidine photolyase-related protein